jgi:hypothetical protein
MLATVPIAKIVYSLLLFLLTVVFVRELGTIWFDKRIFVGNFDVAGATGVESRAFATQVVASQRVFANQIEVYQEQRDDESAADITYALPGLMPINVPTEALPGVEVTYQSVNFTQIFTALRKKMLSPNEVTGVVTAKGGLFQVAVEWPEAPAPKGGGAPLTRFLTPPARSVEAAADYVSCSLSWANAASRDEQVARWSRAQFCDWSGALSDFMALASKANSADGLDEPDTKNVRWRAAQLRSHYGDPHVFAELYRLRADLLDLLPEASKSVAELVDAQEDRLSYAMLSDSLKNLDPEKKRFAALALARPAIRLPEPPEAVKYPENWKALLSPRMAEIHAAANATGLILGRGGDPVGAGFIIGRGLVMTTRSVYQVATNGSAAGQPALCLGATAPTCKARYDLAELVFDGGAQPGNLVIVALKDYRPDPEMVPLAIQNPLPAPNSLSGSYCYLIGFPMRDARMPPEFQNRLLGGRFGERRIMPGRVLAFGPGMGDAGLEGIASIAMSEFTTDISTSAGTSGAPLVDLKSGKVIGVHYAGIWRGERGKFAYSVPIPPEAIAVLDRQRAAASSVQALPSPQPAPPTTTEGARRPRARSKPERHTGPLE